ncbi:hypothetical protein ACQP2T_56785 [Nonomuraea sp. CA-143628]|uniref:hypothetical protein n=1 Tax=Nonomuraea sp. CA-143628 TaxID=3239997 RepID=UPI003D8D16A5
MTDPVPPGRAPVQERRRPRSVVLAAALQLLAAVPFLVGSAVVLFYGAGAQAAAEAEVSRQGLPPAVLADHGISFGSNLADLPLALGIAVILVTLALLNLRGNRPGRLLSWVLQPILFVAGSVIVPSQVFTAQVLESSFKNSGDPVLERIDVPAMVDAAAHVMPGGLLYVNIGKLALTTLGSLLIVTLLATSSARAYFRR